MCCNRDFPQSLELPWSHRAGPSKPTASHLVGLFLSSIIKELPEPCAGKWPSNSKMLVPQDRPSAGKGWEPGMPQRPSPLMAQWWGTTPVVSVGPQPITRTFSPSPVSLVHFLTFVSWDHFPKILHCTQALSQGTILWKLQLRCLAVPNFKRIGKSHLSKTLGWAWPRCLPCFPAFLGQFRTFVYHLLWSQWTRRCPLHTLPPSRLHNMRHVLCLEYSFFHVFNIWSPIYSLI